MATRTQKIWFAFEWLFYRNALRSWLYPAPTSVISLVDFYSFSFIWKRMLISNSNFPINSSLRFSTGNKFRFDWPKSCVWVECKLLKKLKTPAKLKFVIAFHIEKFFVNTFFNIYKLSCPRAIWLILSVWPYVNQTG